MLELQILANGLAVGILHIILTDAGEVFGNLKWTIYKAEIPIISKVFTCSKCFAGWATIVMCAIHNLPFDWVIPIVAVVMFIIKKLECQ